MFLDIFENKECERGTTLRRGCNLCRCVPEVGYACDKTECPPDQPTGKIIFTYKTRTTYSFDF